MMITAEKNYWWPLFLVRQIFHEIMCVFDRIQYERKEIKILRGD